MAEHKMEKIAAYSDRVMLLDDGKLVDFDAPGAIFSRNDLKEHGVIAPSYTRICRELGIKTKEKGQYPVTLEEAGALLTYGQEGMV